MIERLTTTLDVLARSSPADLASEEGRRAAADCADAIRLELDCPQQELTVDQRDVLSALGDLLDAGGDATAIHDVAVRARRTLVGHVAIRFRRATNADCLVAQAIVREALADHGLDLLLGTSDKDLHDLEASYDARGGAFELIYTSTSDEPIGVLGWRPGVAGTLELKKVYLRRTARGLGVGRIAVRRVIDRARALGLQAVVLETANAMTDAIRLYTSLGFRRVSGDDAGAFSTLGQDCEQAFRLDLS
jgi:ribosomal protein S18 acetylase RimI-like enzyme